MSYQVIKNYGHNEGWSCTFRQHRAESHCRFIHGYSLGFELTFECSDLDAHNWCIDFGALKPVKAWLQDMFDHKTLVASDDPQLESFKDMAKRGIIRMIQVEAVGCEMFARMVYEHVQTYLIRTKHAPRVRLASVRVSEHSGNSAVYIGG